MIKARFFSKRPKLPPAGLRAGDAGDLRCRGNLALILLLNKDPWKYLNQPVKVRAYGVDYTGLFKGADEDWVFLQCQTMWVQIPWLEISSFLPAQVPEPERVCHRLPGDPGPDQERKKNREKPGPGLKLIKGEKGSDRQGQEEGKEPEPPPEEKPD